MENEKLPASDLENTLRILGGSEALYQKMIEEVSDYAILILDKQGIILNWNKGANNIKGYTADEIVGKNFRVFYPVDDRQQKLPETLLAQAIRDGKTVHEGWRVKKDGSKFWGSVLITALHNTEGEVIAFSKLTRDLTERKNAEEELKNHLTAVQLKNEQLKQSEERYHRMVAEVQDYAIILLDIDGNIQNWNKGAEKIKGYAEHEIVGQNFKVFYLPEDQKTGLPKRLLSEATANNRATHEGWRVRKDGTNFWGRVVITAMHDEKGNVTGFSKVTRDRTRQKEADDFIMMQNKQLGEYAYVASHDLQEPLRKISIFSSLLRKEVENNQAAMEILSKIEICSQRMVALIKDVLNYSQVKNEGSYTEKVNLNSIIEAIETDFELLLKEKKGRIVYSGLPTIKAIPIQMHQLFANLISNAIKFNDKEPLITIDCMAIQPESNDHDPMIKFTVTDNGKGFDPAYEEQIFKMFHRLDRNDKLGTGIGLALCRKIVENHGGSIHAYSKEGEGAVFEVLLPQDLAVVA